MVIGGSRPNLETELAGRRPEPVFPILICSIVAPIRVVVYKIDRLSRALMDFSKLVEIADRHGVTFVSVTQSFNTTTSMGRLTLNILLCFAQFEREVIGERICNMVAATRKKGIRMGGQVPLGYNVKDRKLIVNPTEAETGRRGQSKTRLDSIRSPRPPKPSIRAPAHGPTIAKTTIALEKRRRPRSGTDRNFPSSAPPELRECNSWTPN